MKKRDAFLPILLLFIICVTLYRIFVPKVIFINKSGYDIFITGHYFDNVNTTKKVNTEEEEEPPKIHYRLLKNGEKTNYRLGFFSNKGGRKSMFWADWSLPIRINGTIIQNKMRLPETDFGWKDITFIIDENGDYYKEDDPQNKLPLITGTRITED